MPPVSIIAKDTPGFIGNRIGMFGMSNILNMVQELGLTVEEIDKLTGPKIGNPKSATFRTSDVVGLDTTVNVAKGIFENCPDDEFRDIFIMPNYIGKMIENNWLGAKTGNGFYKRIKNSEGKSSILSLDLETLEYKNLIAQAVVTMNSALNRNCLLYTSPSPRDATLSRMPSSA